MVGLAVEFSDQLPEVLAGVGAQHRETLFLDLGVVAAHQLHGMVEAGTHNAEGTR